jgi:hypothetical protein
VRRWSRLARPSAKRRGAACDLTNVNTAIREHTFSRGGHRTVVRLCCGKRIPPETVKALTDAGVTLISTTDSIDSSTAAGRMMIGVLGSLAEYGRELVKERTALKRAMSRANGTKFGRRKKVADPSHIATARHVASPMPLEAGVGLAVVSSPPTWPYPTSRR